MSHSPFCCRRRDSNDYGVSACAASRGGVCPPPNCAHATPAMVIAAPAVFSHVNVSPRVSHAITPATGGMRYMKGALRAMPRTLFTQVHASQPTNEHATSAQRSEEHTSELQSRLHLVCR